MTLKILPHGRLQEWVAEEQGSFAAEGLEYTFLPEGDYGVPAGQVATGAFETFGAGRGGADISCACHWATSAAAGQRASLTFQGPPNERLDALLDRQVPAATLFGVPLYIAEAFGFRKVLDATFMIGFLVTGSDVTQADVVRYLAALRRAQMDIDLHPEAFKHHHLRAVPEKYRHQLDVRTFGTGERIVFLPYTREVFAATQAWTRRVFPALPEPAPTTRPP